MGGFSFLPEATGDQIWAAVGSPAAVLRWLALVNLLSFYLMWADKRRAQRGRWRVREITFFVFAALGGSLGAILGMWTFRHKTRHWYFVWGMPLILLVQLALAVFAWRRFA